MGLLKRREMDMTTGPIFKNLVAFAIPLVIASLLQTAFSMADTFVLGVFADNGDLCVGAVSTTGSLINMIISLFIGLSVGANVVVARYIGAKNESSVKRTIGTAVTVSLIAGAILVLVGIFCSRTFLTWIGVSDEFIDLATTYLTIYLCGSPFMLLYNYSANILRASGDTVRPMLYITIGGVINVILNVILVVFTPLDVEGVALATVASNVFASIMCFRALLKNNSVAKFEWRYFRIYKKELLELVRIGVPSGINSALFGFSNTLISSSINKLGVLYGSHIVSGSGYSNQFDNIIYVCMNAIALSGQAFVSQNYGAKNYERIRKTFFTSIGIVSVVGVTVSAIFVSLVYPLIKAISGNPLVAQAALNKSLWIGAFYVLCGIMDVMSSTLRGLGRSLTGMMVTLTGTVFFRVLWVTFVFPINPTETMLYCVYPITWVITIVTFIIILNKVFKNVKRKFILKEKISADFRQEREKVLNDGEEQTA